MLLPLAVAFVSVLGGALLALALARARWIAGPVRALALAATLAAVSLDFLPRTLAALGPTALLWGAAGLFGPAWLARLVGRAGRMRRAPDDARLALEIGYATVCLHQVFDGVGLQLFGHDSHDHTHAGIEHPDAVLAIALHTVPVAAVLLFALARYLGPRAAVVRALGLVAATWIGTFAADGLSGALGPYEDALVALMAGLLLHVLGHDLGHGEARTPMQRATEVVAVAIGLLAPPLLLVSLAPTELSRVMTSLTLASWAVGLPWLALGLGLEAGAARGLGARPLPGGLSLARGPLCAAILGGAFLGAGGAVVGLLGGLAPHAMQPLRRGVGLAHAAVPWWLVSGVSVALVALLVPGNAFAQGAWAGLACAALAVAAAGSPLLAIPAAAALATKGLAPHAALAAIAAGPWLHAAGQAALRHAPAQAGARLVIAAAAGGAAVLPGRLVPHTLGPPGDWMVPALVAFAAAAGASLWQLGTNGWLASLGLSHAHADDHDHAHDADAHHDHNPTAHQAREPSAPAAAPAAHTASHDLPEEPACGCDPMEAPAILDP